MKWLFSGVPTLVLDFVFVWGLSPTLFFSALTCRLLGVTSYRLGLDLTPSLKTLQKWKADPNCFRKTKLQNAVTCLLSLNRYSHDFLGRTYLCVGLCYLFVQGLMMMDGQFQVLHFWGEASFTAHFAPGIHTWEELKWFQEQWAIVTQNNISTLENFVCRVPQMTAARTEENVIVINESIWAPWDSTFLSPPQYLKST